MKSSTSGNDMEPAVEALSSTVEDGNASLLNVYDVSNIHEISITSPKLENSGSSSIDLKINITNRSLDYLGEYEVLRKRVNPPKIPNREVLFAKPTAKPNAVKGFPQKDGGFLLTPFEKNHMDEQFLKTNVEVNIFSNQKEIIHPRDTYKTPQIRGVKRELAKKELSRELAANWRDKKILSSCKALRAAGNFDSLPSAAVARKIRSEVKRSQDRDPDAFCDLYKMQQDKNWSILIQRISSPLEIYLYSENQLNLLFKNKGRLLKMSKKTLFFDATGSVVQKFNKESKRIFLYSMILHARDQKETVGILMPIAEAVLCNHYADDILRFLLSLKTFCQQHRMRWPICQRIVTDWSKAIITAVISAFNDMKSISTYLHKCHNFLTQPGGNLEFLVVQLCYIHIIRMAQKDIATCFENQEVIDFYTKQIVWAIQISELAEFYSWVKGFFTILTQKNMDGRIEGILGNLKKKTSTDDVTVEAGEEKECLKGEIPLYEQSPFYTKGLEIMCNVSTETISTPHKENAFFSKDFAYLFLKKYVAYAPLWTNIMGVHVSKGSTSVSNSPVEGYFSRVKNIILEGQRNVRATDYIRKSCQYIESKLVEISYRYLEDKTDERIKSKQEELLEEKWRRTPKKVKQNFNNKLRLTQKIFKKYNCESFPNLKRNMRDKQFIIGKYNNMFSKLWSDSSKFWPFLELIEFQSLDERKEIYNSVVEIYIHILIWESKRQNVACFSCLEGHQLFYENSPECKSKLKNALTECNQIIIPILHSNHFTLAFINVVEKEFIYIDPFGENEKSVRTFFFIFRDILEDSTIWLCKKVDHYIQVDSFNCGVHICQFVQALFQSADLTKVESPSEYRKIMKQKLMDFTDNLENICLHCGGICNDDSVKCEDCGRSIDNSCRSYHYNNSNEIRCALCQSRGKI
uniref:Ubiquitin-like protease family profile domain-containing protein n=1 Tax=Glossina austeni TaxID=7395 RepID=A0A1A9UDP1_GLOAU